jgi:hypothetical protein
LHFSTPDGAVGAGLNFFATVKLKEEIMYRAAFLGVNLIHSAIWNARHRGARFAHVAGAECVKGLLPSKSRSAGFRAKPMGGGTVRCVEAACGSVKWVR